MKELRTTCPRDCYCTCGLLARVGDSGELLSVRGDPEHPITRGITCPRAAKDPERLITNRVETPYIRRGGKLQKASWTEALDLLCSRLDTVLKGPGPDRILNLDYAGNIGLLTSGYPQRLWNALGTARTDHALCANSGRAGISLHYGHSYGTTPEEFSQMRLLVFWGFNAAVSAPHIWEMARQARKKTGTKIIAVDPVHTKTAQKADIWIRPRSGTDVSLAHGVIRLLCDRGHADLSFITDWTIGFDELSDSVSEWTPKAVEETTGVSTETLGLFVDMFARLRPATTLIGIGLQKCDHGADQARAVSLIPAILGRHRGYYYADGSGFSVDMAKIIGMNKVNRPLKIVEHVGVSKRIQRGEFNFIFVNCTNPAETVPAPEGFKDGVSRDDVFLVVHETHWSTTAQFADIVLPAPTYLEKDDLIIPWGHPYVGLSPAIVSPLTDSRTEVVVMQDIAHGLGLDVDWLYEDPWEAIAPALDGSFETGGISDLVRGALLRLTRAEKKAYETPSKKIELSASQALQMGFDPIPLQRGGCPDEADFILLAGATPHYTHTQFQEVFGAIPAKLLIHPSDAMRLGIKNGARVSIMNGHGEVEMEASISERVLRGVLWAPRQFRGLSGFNHNTIVSPEPQRIGSGPRFNSSRVKVSPVH